MRRLLIALGILAFLPPWTLSFEPPVVAKADDSKAAATKPRIAVFRLSGSITETPGEDLFSFGGGASVSLRELIGRMKKAADDPNVKAVVLLHEGGSIGLAQTEELRQAMTQLRAANKKVYAHADSLTMREYALLSGASRLSVVPTADLWITGISGEAPYLRGLLDLLGVKPDFLTCGAYKSASEIFMRTGPSPEAEKMENWIFDSIYGTLVDLIAGGRNLKPEQVRALVDGGPYSPKKAREAGLIDAVEHRQDFEALLKSEYGMDLVFDKKYGHKEQPKLDLSSPLAPFKLLGDLLGSGNKKPSGKDAVAIVYVDGPIVLGGGASSPFSGNSASASEIRRALDEAARDDSIKAVVLRVDSPGGSAVASEIILDATRRVKAKKPFVVSMGNVAGSGGYYVACAADTIFADDATITGSIGVVAGKLVTNDMWKKVGITFQPYQRGKNAAMLQSGAVFSTEEKARMQSWMDEIYDVFKGHVVAIRGNRLKKPIDDLAGGRVYTGKQALELGLIDRIGTLSDALAYVAGDARLKDYEVRIVPEPKSLLERLIQEATGSQPDRPGLEMSGELRPLPLQTSSLVGLALPHLRHLDPQRVGLIVNALERLQLVNQEGVILMMPELRIGR